MEEKEQVLETSVPNVPGAVEEPVKEESTKEEVAKTYSEDEYKKAMQSAASKAKYDLLKELGIKSVKEFQDEYRSKMDKYDAIEQHNMELQASLDEQLKKSLLSDIDPEYQEEAFILAKAKATDGDLSKAMGEILEHNPNWRKGEKDIKFGTDKSEKPEEPTFLDNLSKKYGINFKR